MCPISQSDGHDGPRLIDEFVPGIATVVEDIVVGEEHAVGEPVVADELPDVLDRVEFNCGESDMRDISPACSGDSACQTALTNGQGQPATVTTSYPCNLTVYGYNFAPGCTLTAQSTESVE